MTERAKAGEKPTDQPADAASDTRPTPTEVDVVAMPSLRADGTPDQTPGYVVIDVKDNASSDES